jgi:flagella basal body P-ring formation protein FlgA
MRMEGATSVAEIVARLRDSAAFAARLRDSAAFAARLRDWAAFAARVRDSAAFAARVRDSVAIAGRLRDSVAFAVVRALGASVVFGLMLLGLSAARGHAQGPSAGEPVRDAIAARWGVSGDSLRIEYQSEEDAAAAAAGVAVRLLGGGHDGVWYVDVEDEAGGSDRLRVRAGFEVVMRVAAHDLERGIALTAGDMALEPTVVWGPRSDAVADAIDGWVTRRRIRKGEALAPPAVQAPLAVKPGQDVRIVYVHGPVELSLAGRAAGSGALGERVAVRAETGKRLEGVIIAPGTVKVDNGAGARR